MTLKPIDALRAIKARIEGNFDHPALVRIGPLHTDPLQDVAVILGMVDSHIRDRAR